MIATPYCALENGFKIFYILEGDPSKPLLMLSHGYGSDHHSFDSIVPYFLPHFQILRWDQLGHGDSDKPKGKTHEETLSFYTIKQLAEDIYLLLKEIGLINCTPKYLYGHSMGGMIALQFSLLHQDILNGLILGSSSPNNISPGMKKMLKQYQTGEMHFNEETFRMNVEVGYSSKYLRAHPEVIEESIRRKTRVGSEILLALMENFVDQYDVSKELHTLTLRTLILSGDRDNTIMVTNSLLMKESIPNVDLVIFPKMSHAINVEIPDQVAKLICEYFLTERK